MRALRVAAAVSVVAACSSTGHHAGCYAYVTPGDNDHSYIIIVDGPADAHAEWDPRPMTQEQCEAVRDAGLDGKTISEMHDMATAP